MVYYGYDLDKKGFIMEKIAPEFKDVNELNQIMLIAVLTIVFWIWVPLIAFFAFKDTLSPAGNDVVKALLNFEILITIGVIISGAVPILGWFVSLPVFTILHYIITIIATINILNKTEINIWAPIKFLK